MRNVKDATGNSRELGVVVEFGRLDARGKPIGSIRADSDNSALYFEDSQAPFDIRRGDAITFERDTFRCDYGNRNKAIKIRRISDTVRESETFALCSASRNDVFWLPLAAEHLSTLDAPQQLSWLKERAGSLSSLSEDAWRALEPRVLQDPQIWRVAPATLREARLNNADMLFKVDFLAAEAKASEAPDRFPPAAEMDNLKVKFVEEWAKDKLGLKLDYDQAAVVAEVSGDVQVIARAGSGKTRALVTRAIFLQKHCRVQPHQMLLLAFNNKAAKEMRERLEKVLGDEIPHVMTFHALAHALVHPKEEIIYDDSTADNPGHSREVQGVIDEHIRSASHGRKVKELMLAHFREDWERIDEGRFVLPMDEFLAHRRSLPRETLNGESVKSFGEKLIANALFEHDIKYRYESNFRWNGANYRPDFMIGSHQDGGIVIEYFGMTGDPDYDEMSEEKRGFWSEPERARRWRFLEYSPADITRSGTQEFVSRLLRDLKARGLHPRQLSEEELWERVKGRAIDDFTKAMRNFVTRCRKHNLVGDELANRISAHACCSEAERLFLEVGQSIYSDYVRRLASGDKEDFDGLMWRAIAKVGQGSTEFIRARGKEQGDLKKLRFLMVDEFQDFSEMFSRLLQGIRNQNPSVDFFCVGDDWQAINGFAGSDLRYFEAFEEHFRKPSKRYIRTNWRSERAIVEVGNTLMRGLGEPAIARGDAGAGECKIGWLNEFQPTAPEQERYEGDELTPAVLRLVSDFLKRGMDVVMLSRTNRVPWYVNYTGERRADGVERFQEHIRSFLPEDDRRRVTASTTHKYKGLEKQAVVVLDALDRRYPLVHPHWVFLRLFGDSVDRIVTEERRLFYVALTRAEKTCVLLTESKRPSRFLEDLQARPGQRVDWSKLQPVGSSDCERVEVRVSEAYEVRDQLKRQGYSWAAQRNSNNRYWRKSLQRDGFNFERDILSQSWTCGNVRIEVFTETGELLNSWPHHLVPRPR